MKSCLNCKHASETILTSILKNIILKECKNPKGEFSGEIVREVDLCKEWKERK